MATQAGAETIWVAAQKVLREMLNQDIYNLWFANLRPTGLNGDEITLEVANDFCEVWLSENYLALLQDILAHVSGRKLQVKFQLAAGAAHNAPAAAPTISINGTIQ